MGCGRAASLILGLSIGSLVTAVLLIGYASYDTLRRIDS